MAPSKKAVPGNARKAALATLEGPVSLLWAYQLRREHALLLTQMDGLAETVSSVAPLSMLREIKHDVQIAAERATAVENEVRTQGLDLQAIRNRVSGGDQMMADMQNQIADMARHQKETVESLVRQQQRLVAQIEVDVENSLRPSAEEQQEQIRKLASREKPPDNFVGELSNQDAPIVHDSLKDNFSPRQNTAILRQEEHRHHRGSLERRLCLLRQPVSHAEELLQELDTNSHDLRDADMLALRPIGQVDETLDDEFDLDQDVASLSYARHFHRSTVPQESMKMLPELCEIVSQPPNTRSLTSLKQTASQTWETYLKRGEEFIKSLPKRKEGAVVDLFVEGVLDPVLRATCELWLDERVWIWDNVKTFAATYRQSEGNPGLSSTLSPSPLPEKENEKLRGPLKRIQAAKNDLARLLKDQKLLGIGVEQSTAQNEGCGDRRRRSQRVVEKESHTAGHALNQADRIAPAASCPTSKRNANTRTPFLRKESSQLTQVIPKTVPNLQKDTRVDQPQVSPRKIDSANHVLNAAAEIKTPAQSAGIDVLCLVERKPLPVSSQKRKFELDERHVSKKKLKLSRKKRGRAPIIPILPSSDIDPGDGI